MPTLLFRRPLARGLLVMALTASTPALAEQRPRAVIPFEPVGDHIVVDARVNGRTGRFILDTGSGAASVTPEFAKGLNLHVMGGPVEVSGAGAGTTEIRVGEAREVRLGPIEFSPVPVLVLSNDPFKPAGQPMSGALGYDVFAKWTVSIDFNTHELTFRDPKHYTPPPRAVILPADLSRRVPMVNVLVRATRTSALVRAKLVLDTGTSSFPLLFSPDFATRSGLDAIMPRRVLALGSGTGGLSTGAVLRVAEVDVAGLRLHTPVVGVPADRTGFFASGVADGTIGQGLFHRGRLTVDYPHHRIVFEPGRDIGAAWDYPDRCGWMLGKDDDGDWAVLYVGERTPASDAGVHKGDKISAVAALPTADMTRETLRAACGGNGPLDLTIHRGGGTVSATIHRRKLI